MKIFSNSWNSSARLFLMKEFFALDKNNIIITDNNNDLHLLENFAGKIFGENPIKINSIGEFLSLKNNEKWIFFANVDIFRTEGNLYHIEKSQNIKIQRNTEISMEEIVENLVNANYEFSDYLGEKFCYQKNGWILSIIANNVDITYQIEWFGDEIDSILSLQNSTKERKFLNEINLPFRKMSNFDTNNGEQKLNPINTEFVEKIPELLSWTNILISWCDFLKEISLLQKIAIVHFSELSAYSSQKLNIEIPEINNINELIAFFGNKKNEWFLIKIFTKNRKNILDFLENNKIQNIEIFETNERKLESFCIENEEILPKIAIITDDILWKIFVKSRKNKNIAKNLDLLISLLPGDFVVHRDHWIGKFEAIVKKKVWELEREYLEIHYAGNDKLFVPITEIFRISKYLGNQDVELTKLWWKEWEKTIKKTDEELQIIAENILETNARRQLTLGRAFGRFEKEEKIFREKFPYEYTADQLNGILDVFEDMEREEPMDRLLSGDVGFGKTEIAMNAVYKAVLSGSQVAVISPLVVLAMEHYESFVERLWEFGVKVAMLTRMNTPKESEKILQDMKNWNVDVVIGTHRLLSDDIKWKKLWLLIIDEEHKFWVIHKEKIKKIRAWIDILSLSATPIPRSLNLALSGLRKISLLSTPPKKKKPIETIITSWNENIVKTAIEQELERWGQVIIVHNRIAWIESLKQEIETIIEPHNIDAKIIITHGRMHGDEIEDRIHDFKQKKYNILLTTTIIENGVNFLSANTIIIIDPEDFGLASLHQLRWRVGRKWDQWYCYLAYRKTILSEEEKERLITIANNNHLGAGFEIAMRDMEIRWAGDILGIKQSWKSKDVWLPLYFRMLEEKIAELKNEKIQKVHTKIELDLSYLVDDDFFASELDKLNFYREIENIETLEELETVENEFLTENQNVKNLFLLLKAKIVFGEYNVEKISKLWNFYNFDFKKWNSIENLKKFLDIFDKEKNMIVVTPEKLRIDVKIFGNSENFLKKILKI